MEAAGVQGDARTARIGLCQDPRNLVRGLLDGVVGDADQDRVRPRERVGEGTVGAQCAAGVQSVRARYVPGRLGSA